MSHTLIWLAFKVAITVTLVATLLALLDLDKLVVALHTADLGPIVIALFILLLRYPFMGLRWHLILKYQGYFFSTIYLTKVTLVSVFFSLFLPSGSGADIVRGIYLTRQKVELRDTITSILCDRIVGLFTLLAIATPSTVILALRYPIYQTLALTILALVGSFAVGLFVLNRISEGFSIKHDDSRRLLRLCQQIAVGLRELMQMAREPALLLKVVLLTILFQAIGIYSVYLLGLALHADLGLVFYAVLVPIVWIVTMLPISVGGLGIREGAFIVLFSQVGMDSELALALSLLVFSIDVVQSLLGSIIFLLDRLTSFLHREAVR